MRVHAQEIPQGIWRKVLAPRLSVGDVKQLFGGEGGSQMIGDAVQSKRRFLSDAGQMLFTAPNIVSLFGELKTT